MRSSREGIPSEEAPLTVKQMQAFCVAPVFLTAFGCEILVRPGLCHAKGSPVCHSIFKQALSCASPLSSPRVCWRSPFAFLIRDLSLVAAPSLNIHNLTPVRDTDNLQGCIRVIDLAQSASTRLEQQCGHTDEHRERDIEHQTCREEEAEALEPEAVALAAEGAALGDEVVPEVAVASEEAGEADEEAGR